MSIKKVKSKSFPSGYGYQVLIHRKGLPRIRQTFESHKIASDIHDAILGDAARRKFNLPVESHVTLRELISRHLSELRARGRDKTNVKRAETVLDRFAALAGENRMVESINSTADLTDYVNLRLAARIERPDGPSRALAPQTINRELNEIKSCLTAAATYYRQLEGYRSPRAPWLEEPTDGRRQTWSDEQIMAVLRELYQPKRPKEKDSHVAGRRAVGDLFVVALETGCRAGEVRKLKKSQISFAQRLIRITSQKGMSRKRSARTREIPMTDISYEILRRRYDQARGPYLFAGSNPERPLATHIPTFIKACKRAGIDYGIDGEDSLIFNDARRTKENKMLDAGHSPRAVADIQGHSIQTMARNYARSTQEMRREALSRTALPKEMIEKILAASG
jgi:integrase